MASEPQPPADEQRGRGNEAFRRRDYAAAVSHYSTALGSLAADGAPPQQQLRAALLTNRALAQHRMGRYAAAAQDAEAALEASASDGKATLRAAAARLMLGDGAAAARHAALFAEQGAGAGGDSAAAPTQQLAAAALARHAAALAAHQQRLAELAQSPAADDCAVADLLAALEAEAEGSGDGAAGPADLAQQLAKRLAADAAAAARLEALQGHQLLIFFLADPDPACQQAAAAALRAAGQAAAAGSPGVVLWPAAVWRRLAALATEAGGAGSALAMQLLGWAAEQDAWVRQHSLLHPLAGAAAPPSAGMTVSPVAQIAGMLGDSARLQRMQPAAVTAAACLLRLYASDAAAAEGLLAQGCQPLLALLRAAAAVESMVVFQPAPDASGSEGSSASSSTADAEEEARQQLRLKLQRVFVGEAVALRHALLGAAADLAAASRALLLAEAVREVDSGKKQAAAGPLLAELLGLARELHEQQPRRTAPELGPDGQPKAYAKRRFAADFKDNPAGDFLLTLDGLQPGSASTGGSSTSPQACTGSTSSAAAGQQPTTLLERALSLLQHVACASGSAAALLHRRGLFSLCEELGAYCTPSVVAAAQRLYAAVADRLPAAAEELLQSGSAASLAALLLHSAAPQRQRQALDKLVAMADTCSGDEFAALAGTTPGLPAGAARECAVFKAWQLASAAQQPGKNGAASALASAATAFLLRCCERAQRQQQLGPGVPPRGGAWGAIGRQGLLSLLRQARPGAAAAAGQQQQQEPAFSSSMRKGFLAGPSQAAGKAANGAACKSSGGGGSSGAAASSPPSISTHSYKRGGVVIEELPSQATAAAAAAAAPPLAAPAAVPSPRAQPRAPEPEPSGAVEQEGEEDAEEEAVAELRDVFDSSSSATAEQRRARAEWLAVPGEQRLRWSQTSGDVSVYVAVPAGTRASEVQVTVTAERLEVGLKWFGRIAEGPLHRRVRAGEAHWCLEDREVHVLLPKADGAVWKALLQGGAERSYMELLREAVDADEPVVPYDQLGEESKELIAAIQERQAYVAAGLIGLETSVDDFRVVLGESSLGGAPPARGK